MIRKIPLLIVGLLAFMLSAAATFLYIAPNHSQLPRQQVVSGKALIGGPFTLINHKGETVTDKSFRGQYMLVYFGYTFCPDVCPAELAVITDALEMLGEKAARVTPVFITVDPERDTVEQVAEYVSNFHPRMVGLTGSPDQIKAAAKAYRVYYRKAKDESSSAAYMMDHSSIIFLMGPDGQYLSHFAYGTKPETMAAKLAQLIR